MDSPMCLVENTDCELHVVPGALKYLMRLNQQVVVVAVVGLYRTEEKERSAVLEQEKKAAEEKRLEMERTMEDDRRSKDEKLKQMEEKMKEEMKQQERDFHRALECKMQEQKDLLEKGHKEKADLMRQEIEEFKKSNTPEKEGGGFLESTVMPVLRFGLDAANTVFQYKLMRGAFMK